MVLCRCVFCNLIVEKETWPLMFMGALKRVEVYSFEWGHSENKIALVRNWRICYLYGQ
jgi:hypothetical protein